METKRSSQFSLQIFIFSAAILLLSSRAFCADPNSTITQKITEPAKQTETKTSSQKITRPRVSPSVLTPDTPFKEALDILSNCVTPPLNIVVKWKELDEIADITPDTPIGMNGLAKTTLRTHLNILLLSLSTESAKLGFVVEGNAIIIGIKETLPVKMVTRTYDIADIVAPPSMGGMMGMGMGMMGIGMGMGGITPYGSMTGYGNMSSYGTFGNQYGTGYGYNQGYMNQGYNTQTTRPYGYQSTQPNTGSPFMLGF